MKLTDSVSILPFVGPNYEGKLARLDVLTIEDLLLHIPNRYLDFSKVTDISNVKIGEIITIVGNISSLKNQITKSGKRMQIGQVEDSTGKITIAWFNQPFLIYTIPAGTKIAVSGEASWFAGKPAFFSPQFEKIEEGKDTLHTGRLVGIYSETAGLSSKWLKSRIKYTLDNIENNLDEFLPKEIIKKYLLVDYKKAIFDIHFPETVNSYVKAKERLAFNELLNLQLEAKRRKQILQKKKTNKLTVDKKEVDDFIKNLPFKLTNSQTKVVDEILTDLTNDIPMNRLLQGDVGSGKTVVSAIAALVTILNGLQVVLMAPTQILANQHYETINSLFNNLKIRIALITGTKIKKDIGRVDIFIGTHALLTKTKLFEKLGLIVIDEQHKFGVKQTEILTKSSKNKSPHILTMTATPIPRTIALNMLSDMDLSTLNEIPIGRIPIKTWLVPNEKRKNAYDWIGSQIKEFGSQAFVVCPLVEDSEKETMKDVKAVKSTFIELEHIFSKFKLGLLHGKLKESEKNKILDDFKKKKLNILVTTPVVEVGIDVPNATIMLIEASDRFGLAQLHQLRGRVGRGDKQSYCLLFTENESERVSQRLTALTTTSSGFELAELDLSLRGPGEVLGIKQHGFGNLKIASWSDTKLIRISSEVANKLI
ncbi:ATP-dependent DNA helicase RecG [Candidatus Woesebacteria bacterium RIFOXYC1_FULL_31_51]|uniref:ATP-dependent DNA helicase RecG n=1 Tax=Candidatus Woesebacteria bacterium GW2011_GWC2_31_9 TaxID=1618586 RepID=A0A0G0BKE1_9BACT|nr:MAG: ATP-dependent DNA helicase, ATP-dependent DNA helicase RecG [Candidatus Woesebacteria bacterium GW2011_GWF1_31_35]KKP22695.1 MAG: ATP-dependent DNA helicase [Candidatus Woesebacteria bacterium GW2011_GWC1_30_29]KKP25922.1 MAG: ATP-dependent DNA helicase [Candidatus Woesebacteria bacterium GW2011_GWD1_31_12]KKP27148.1 MAG: ATP-dependent DNA helicase [Candidatus Woesebacteria bacterium GW2011_GWB1_31_29]KKP31527.1 MAG: ATP-dependent DNA helicase [Candidatus Woesebacteria bacterium GW2011_